MLCVKESGPSNSFPDEAASGLGAQRDRVGNKPFRTSQGAALMMLVAVAEALVSWLRSSRDTVPAYYAKDEL
jgi:hypothetical protein